MGDCFGNLKFHFFVKITLNNRYDCMLTYALWPTLEDCQLDGKWFQQDDTMSHPTIYFGLTAGDVSQKKKKKIIFKFWQQQ